MSGENDPAKIRDEIAVEVAILEAQTEDAVDTMGRAGKDLGEIRDDPDVNFRLGQIAYGKKWLKKLGDEE